MGAVVVTERYSCPWCPTKVIAVEGGSAMAVFEQHLDEHFASQVGETYGVIPPVPPRPRRPPARKKRRTR